MEFQLLGCVVGAARARARAAAARGLPRRLPADALPPCLRPLPRLSPAADPAKPARGVILKYPGGSNAFCPRVTPLVPLGGGKYLTQNRTLSVELLCGAGSTDFSTASVYETNSCDYRIQLRTVAGCPVACQTGATVCSGAGICAYDTDNKVSACFCNAGAAGPQCGGGGPAPSKALSAEAVILIVVCIMLAGVLGAVGFMFIKLRKLQVDPAAYGQLEGKFNELGMLA